MHLKLRRKKARCPIDQMILSSKQLFHDRSAQREVLDLNVRCPHTGCNVQTELRNIQVLIWACHIKNNSRKAFW